MVVIGPPRAAVNSVMNIPTISDNEVLHFTLKSNPPPHDFYFELDLNRSLYEFQASCSPDPDKPYLARCSVKAVNIPSDYLGLCNATAVSTLGNFSFLFRVVKGN